MTKHDDVLARIDNAVRNFFEERYQPLYEEASDLLKAFNAAKGMACGQASLDDFQAKVMRGEQTGGSRP